MSSETMVSIRSHRSSGLQRRPVVYVLVALVYCVLLTGCIVAPIPMTKRVEARGEASGKAAPDLSLLHSGQATRKDVSEQLSVIDTGYTGEDLFFGRWVSSGSGWIWMIAGDNTGEGGYWRNWRVHNLLVRFDKNGTVEDFNEVDDKQVLKTLARMTATQLQTADLSVPISMEVQCRRGLINLALNPDSIVFDHSDAPKIHVRIAPMQIANLRLLRPHHPDAASLQMRMDFQTRTALGRQIRFTISPSDAVRFVQYIESVNSSRTMFR